jgi:hypothetical protein
MTKNDTYLTIYAINFINYTTFKGKGKDIPVTGREGP